MCVSPLILDQISWVLNLAIFETFLKDVKSNTPGINVFNIFLNY